MKIIILAFLLTINNFAQTYPTAISESVDTLLKILSIEDKALIKHTPNKNLFMFHHNIGMWIRNNFGLWGKNDSLLYYCAKVKNANFIHPDDASGIIIDSLWNKLQKQNINFEIPPSIVISSDTIDNEKINKLLKFIPYPEIAWRAGINTEITVIIETDSKIKLKSITFSQIENDAGFSFQIDKSIKDNWNEITQLLKLEPNSKLEFDLVFNSLGKKFEEYSKK